MLRSASAAAAAARRVAPRENAAFARGMCSFRHHNAVDLSIVREPMAVKPHHQPVECSTAADVLKDVVTSDSTIFVHSAAATPGILTDALADVGREKGLSNVEVTHIHTEGQAKYAQPEYAAHFRSNSMFTGANCRKAVNEGRGDYTSIFLSEIPQLFRRGFKPLDVAMLQVSPPDKHGYCSMGVSVDVSRAAAQCAKVLVAVLNPQMPVTHGDSAIHISHFDRVMHHDAPLHCMPPRPETQACSDIGRLIAENLVQDGATLQMGIGTIPDATLACLGGHKDLGVHTEMFSDGIIDLVKKGVINNSSKTLNCGASLTSFLVGTQALYDFVDHNPAVRVKDVAYTNDTSIIEQEHRVTAINSCIEVDLTGQVVSDSIGSRIYSGVGGQVDFLRGAGRCDRGVPILALPSTTSKGASRIVPTIKSGGGVVTTRSHVHYIVTEHGIAHLFGKSMRERATALIGVAHPDHREQLEREGFEAGVLQRSWGGFNTVSHE